MIAGGASLAPRRWSLPALATRDAQQFRVLGDGPDDGDAEDEELGVVVRVSPGLSRFSPASVAIDQLLCLPEPLMPANGFSCSRQTRPYFSAVRRMTSIVSIW